MTPPVGYAEPLGVCLNGWADLVLNFNIRKCTVDSLLNLIFKISFFSDKDDSLLSIDLYLLFYHLISLEHEGVGWEREMLCIVLLKYQYLVLGEIVGSGILQREDNI